jgi:predicted transcriptional regulator
MDAVIEIREALKKKIDAADRHILEQIEDLLEFGDRDPLLNMSPEQEASLLRGIKDADEGRTTPHEEVMKKYSQWLTK